MIEVTITVDNESQTVAISCDPEMTGEELYNFLINCSGMLLEDEETVH